MSNFSIKTAGLLPFLLCVAPIASFSQVSLTASGTTYTQNFNSVAFNAAAGGSTTITNNTTITGWYVSDNTVLTHLAATSPRNNTGSSYSFSDSGDKSLGTRPSGGTGDLYMGVRLKNDTGSDITSLQVKYAGEQWSIAENQNNVNTLEVSYRLGATVTSLTGGTWTAVPELRFVQLFGSAQSASKGGTACTGSSSQCLALNGNNPDNRSVLTACIPVTIPAGQEIMIRWTDEDNSANDHHLQIDDVEITGFNVSCADVLPVTWVSVESKADRELEADISWTVASEKNNNYFEVQIASDEDFSFKPAGTVFSLGDTQKMRSYNFRKQFASPGNYYFRIRQTDFDGRYSYSGIGAVRIESDELYMLINTDTRTLCFSRKLRSGTSVAIYDFMGRKMSGELLEEDSEKIHCELPAGFTGYLVIDENGTRNSFPVRLD